MRVRTRREAVATYQAKDQHQNQEVAVMCQVKGQRQNREVAVMYPGKGQHRNREVVVTYPGKARLKVSPVGEVLATASSAYLSALCVHTNIYSEDAEIRRER